MKTYTTIAGETWDIIAYKLFGDEFKMTELQQANTAHLGTVVFGPGVVLNVPVIETPTASEMPPWKV